MTEKHTPEPGVKRYGMSSHSYGLHRMEQQDDGEYVLADDYTTLRAALDECVAALERLTRDGACTLGCPINHPTCDTSFALRVLAAAAKVKGESNLASKPK